MTWELKDNPFARFEDKADESVPTATLMIYNHLFLNSSLRQKDTHTLRASSANYCYKRNWYQRKGLQGIPLTPRKWVNFLLGDLTEKVIIHFIKTALVGDGKIYSEVDFGEVVGTFPFDGVEFSIYRQKTVTTRLGPHVIPGHADGWGKRNTDGKWELIEIKSSSNYGFKEFSQRGIMDYQKQSHVLMLSDEAKARGVESSRFFFMRKETGHIWDRVLEYNPELKFEIQRDYDLSQGEEEPKAPFLLEEIMKGKGELQVGTGVFKAKFPCNYCPYIEHCKGEYQTEWKKNQWGHLVPTFTFKEKK